MLEVTWFHIVDCDKNGHRKPKRVENDPELQVKFQIFRSRMQLQLVRRLPKICVFLVSDLSASTNFYPDS